jgi:glucokinase
MIVAGDIGGTYCRLAACADGGRVVAQKIYSSRDYRCLADTVLEFMAHTGYRFKIGCFGLPGAVIGQRCRLTNLAWEIVDAGELAVVTDIGRVILLNDVAANAYGIATLASDEILTINPGEPVLDGNIVVVSPGTGLGEAARIFVDGNPVVIASEGGHAEFGPIDDAEIALLKYVQRSYRCATYELILSGSGLERMYQVQRTRSGRPTPDWLAARLAVEDPASVISEIALSRHDEACIQALDMYVSILAAEASNAALKFLTLGGVYLGGGIVPRISAKLLEPLFMARFACKDKMAELLRRIPVHIIMNDRTALQGAIARAVAEKLYAVTPRE